MDDKNQFDYSKALQSILSLAISILIGFIAWQSTKWSTSIDTLSQNVGELNSKIQVILTEMNYSSQISKDHELRIRALEDNKFHKKYNVDRE